MLASVPLPNYCFFFAPLRLCFFALKIGLRLFYTTLFLTQRSKDAKAQRRNNSLVNDNKYIVYLN